MVGQILKVVPEPIKFLLGLLIVTVFSTLMLGLLNASVMPPGFCSFDKPEYPKIAG